MEPATKRAVRRVRQEGRALRGGGRSRERARAAGPRQPVRSARQRPPVRSGADRDLALKLGALMLCTLTSEGGAVIKAVDESGLNFPQMKVLVTLAGHEDEPASMKRIAEHLGISLASASRAVDTLVKRDLATRIEDPDDRRVRHVSLTAEGQGIADELMAARLAGLEGFIATLAPPERRKLEAALEVLLRREDVGSTYRTHRRRVLR
jgi:DNA-binding MarR family transcriptional regulator